jgi:hypothetical protein
MSDYLYNAQFGIFQRMNLEGESTPALPNIIIPENVDAPIHADKRFLLNAEHSHVLDDEDVINAIINASNSYPFMGSVTSREEWDALSRVEQIAEQGAWCN